MPASSITAVGSWGGYLLASAVLVLLLSPELSQVASVSRASADWRSADGAREAIDSLRPGVVAPFTFGGEGSDPLHLHGREISCAEGNGTITMAVKWALPNDTLSPGVEYRLSLAQGTVVVQSV